jgi:hypothetical protein
LLTRAPGRMTGNSELSDSLTRNVIHKKNPRTVPKTLLSLPCKVTRLNRLRGGDSRAETTSF